MANTTDLGLASEILGHIAYGFNSIKPYLQTELHTILAALFPIVIGAHASLNRPTTAAKPQKRKAGKKASSDEESDEEEEEEEKDTFQRMEGFSRSDALWLPLYAGITLAGLYLLIMKLKDLDMLNKVLNYYFSSVGVFSVCKLLADALQFVYTFMFPKWYADGKGIWQVNQRKKETINTASHAVEMAPRKSPLPGILAKLPLPTAVANVLWKLRQVPDDKLTVKFYVHKLAAGRFHISLLGFIGVLLGLAATLYYNFVEKAWWLTNLMGFAFSYSALQLMSPTTFDTGSLILSALFVYDIVMVFYTPMMVTVAKNLDVPIKLLIPRAADKNGVAQFSMLGLGDVVLPGMMMALALRFDLYLHYLRLQTTVKTRQGKEEVVEVVKAPFIPPGKYFADQFWTTPWFGARKIIPPSVKMGSFSKTYFWTSVVGYALGMVTTLFVMITFKHAQPALLYLVPAVLISLWGTALVRGEFGLMLAYTEAEEEHESTKEGDGKDGKIKSTSGSSIFSATKMDRNEAKVKKALEGLVEHGDSEDETGIKKRGGSKEKAEGLEKKLRKDKNRDFFFLAVSRYSPLNGVKEKTGMSKEADEGDEHGRKRQRVA